VACGPERGRFFCLHFCQVTQQRRTAADRGEYRQATGGGAQGDTFLGERYSSRRGGLLCADHPRCQYAKDRLRCSTYFFAIFSVATVDCGTQANPLAYATTGDNQFGVVDLLTGVFTQKGKMGVRLTGLGEVGGELYGGGYASGTLYSVNPSTGALTKISGGSLTYWATGSTKRGLFALDNSANMEPVLN
jgi:hypothetical protein